MLHLRRRHLKSCEHRAGAYLRCKCPLWAIGTLDGKFIRKALDTRNLEKGTQLIAEMDLAKVERVFLSEAIARFLADCERRNSKDTTAKYRLLFKELKESVGDPEVRSISTDDLSKFCEGWKIAPITQVKKLERLRSFFKFCVDRGWCKFNTAVPVRKSKAKFKQRMPFTDAEVEKILWATEIYPIKGIYGSESRKRIRAFVRLLLSSGIRIRDAVTLDVSRFVEGSKLLIPTQKTGQPVVLPLPPDVAGEIQALQKGSHPYFFWSGNGLPKSAVADWQRSSGRCTECRFF